MGNLTRRLARDQYLILTMADKRKILVKWSKWDKDGKSIGGKKIMLTIYAPDDVLIDNVTEKS